MKAETEEKDLETQVRHPDVDYDRGDLPHGSVFGFLIALFCGVLVVHVFLWGVFQYMGKPQFVGHASTNPIMTSKEQLQEIGGDPAIVFPKPNLQPDPVADLNKFRASEEEQMNTYGWVDPAAKKIHIPIERAIDVVSSSWPNQHGASGSEEKSSQDFEALTQKAVEAKNRNAGAQHAR
jgi:hypothetical protein